MARGQGRRYRSSMIGLNISTCIQHGRSRQLTLDRQMSLKSVVGNRVVEDLLKRRIFQCGTVDIPRYPVIVKHRCALSISSGLQNTWTGLSGSRLTISS